MRAHFFKLLKNPFVHGSFYLTASNFLIGFFNYLFNIFAARLIGPAGYGDITALFSFVALLSTPLSAIGTVLIQKIGKRGEDSLQYSKSLELLFFKNLKKFWPVLVLSLFIIPFTPKLTNMSPLVAYSLIPILIYSFLATVYDGILQGLHLFFWFSILGIIMTVLKLAGVGVASLTIYHLAAIMTFVHLSYILRIGLSKWVLHKKLPKKIHASANIEKSVIQILTDKHLIITVVSLFSIVLLNNLDIIYVKRAFSAEDAGIYSAWALFAKIILYILSPLLSLAYIFFSSKKTLLQQQLVMIGGLLFLVVVGIISNFGYGYFDTMLIKLIFGEKFLSLKPFLEWAALFGIGYVMVLFMNYYFLAHKSKNTFILPCTIPLYVIGLFVYADSMANLIFLNTTFIFFVLTLYLIAFFRDRIIFLFQRK